jgi:hypothetical protein
MRKNMEFNKVKLIESMKNTIQSRMKNVNCARFNGRTFGNEDEYTCKSLFYELNSLFADVTVLTKSREQFLKLSTYEERLDIYNALKAINQDFNHAQHVDIINLIQSIDGLKQVIRPFNICYANGRHVDLENEFLELTSKRQEFTQKLNNFNIQLIEFFANKKRSDKVLKELQVQQNELNNVIKFGKNEIVALINLVKMK